MKISTNSIIRATGAAILLVSLFLNWWKAGFDDVSAWTALETLDMVLAAIALAVLAATASRFHSEVPNRLGSIPQLPLGIAAVVIIVVLLVNDPPSVFGADPAFGLWAGLTGAVLIAVGALLSEKRISIVVAEKDESAAHTTDSHAAAAEDSDEGPPEGLAGADGPLPGPRGTAPTEVQPAKTTDESSTD